MFQIIRHKEILSPEIHHILKSGKSRLDYLSLNIPENYNPSVIGRNKFISFFYVNKLFNCEGKRIQRFVDWLDLDDTSFNNVLHVFRRKEFLPGNKPIYLFGKRWCESIIWELCTFICCRNDSRVRHFVFLNIVDILDYYKYLNPQTKQRLLGQFLKSVPEDDYYFPIIIKMKKILFNKYVNKNIVFRHDSIILKPPNMPRQIINHFYKRHGYYRPYMSEYELEYDKQYIFFLLFRYGYTNRFRTGSVCNLRKLVNHCTDDEDYLEHIFIKRMTHEIVFRVFQVILMYLKKTEIYSASELKVIWDTITDPYLVVEDFLPSPDVLPSAHPETREQFLEIYKWYAESVYPESSDKTPRSLLHLARCKIRACLGARFLLPEGIFDLKVTQYGTSSESSIALPYHLRRYLLLEDVPVLRNNSLRC